LNRFSFYSYPEANVAGFIVNQDGYHMEGVLEKQQELEKLCSEQAAKIEQLTRLVTQFLCLMPTETWISTYG